jgi:hypothetical protein
MKQQIHLSELKNQISFTSPHLTPFSQITTTFSQIQSINMFPHNEAAHQFGNEGNAGFLARHTSVLGVAWHWHLRDSVDCHFVNTGPAEEHSITLGAKQTRWITEWGNANFDVYHVISAINPLTSKLDTKKKKPESKIIQKVPESMRFS